MLVKADLEAIIQNAALDLEEKKRQLAAKIPPCEELGEEDISILNDLFVEAIFYQRDDIAVFLVKKGADYQAAFDFIIGSARENKSSLVSRILAVDDVRNLEDEVLADSAVKSILLGTEEGYRCAVKFIDHKTTSKHIVWASFLLTLLRSTKGGITEESVLPRLKRCGFVTVDEMRQDKRQMKKEIMDQGALSPLATDLSRKPTVAQAIMSMIYFGASNKEGVFTPREIDQLYEATHMKPLMEMISLSGLGVGLPENKKFKIVGHRDRVPNPFIYPEIKGAFGGKYTAFLRIEGSPNIVLADSIHESTHFAMQTLYQNDTNPYPNNDGGERRGQYFDVVTRTAARIIGKSSEYVVELEPGALQERAYNSMNIISSYALEDYSAEFIVRVPEIISMLGPDAGPIWLEHNFPELFCFYRDVVNLDLQKYCIDHLST